MANFEKSLEIGKRIESIVLNRVRESDPFALIIRGKFKQFDIYSPSTNTRIEVKSDIQSQHTNNFLIEVYMYGKPSALLSTEADIWCFFDNKDLILQEGYQQRVITGKGDTKSKRCYLIPTKEIYLIANKVESVHEEERIKTI